MTRGRLFKAIAGARELARTVGMRSASATTMAMPIWMSNTRGNQTYDRELFAIICDSLILRRGSPRVTENCQSLIALAMLPWLDQPVFLEPARLIAEIHDAWGELWTVRAEDLSLGSHRANAMRSSLSASSQSSDAEQTLGCYLARPLHELTAFAASSGKGDQLRVGTHRQLIVEPQRLQGWRVIRG